MRKRQTQQPKPKLVTRKLAPYETELLGDKQYEQAMKHVKKQKQLREQKKKEAEPIDPQCTFHPISYTQYYRPSNKQTVNKTGREDKPEQRLLKWGRKKDKKHIERVLCCSLEAETKIANDQRLSIGKRESPKYLKTYRNFKTMIDEKVERIKQQKLSKKQLSSTTLFSDRKNNKQSLPLLLS